jgi:transposase
VVCEPLLPHPAWLAGKGGRPSRYCMRDVADAIRYLTHNGPVWRALPADFPPAWTVYYWAAKWQADGSTEAMHGQLRDQVRQVAGRKAAPTAAIIDSQSGVAGYAGRDAGWLAGRDATSTADAATGGQALAHFETGLQATHQPGIPSHTVVLGHSYGSLVVGEAAAHDGLHTGDIIFVGSPGVGVNNVAQLGMPSAHAWAGANVHDPVPQLPPSNPLTALGNDNAGHFGNNPATSAFGAQVFNANHDPSRSFSGLDLSAHSAYWDANSDSLKNMARIVDGQYSGVTMQNPPTLSPLPDPGPIVGPGVI